MIEGFFGHLPQPMALFGGDGRLLLATRGLRDALRGRGRAAEPEEVGAVLVALGADAGARAALRAFLAGADESVRIEVGDEPAGRIWRADLARAAGAGGARIFLSLADVTEERLAAERDPLTRLPNRRAMLRVLAGLLAGPEQESGLATIDLVGFGRANDRHGHAFGDRLLQHFAMLLEHRCGARGLLPHRIGGDEFALAWRGPRAGEAEEALDGIEAAFRAIMRPILPEGEAGRSLRSRVLVVRPAEGQSPDALLWAADCKRAAPAREGLWGEAGRALASAVAGC